MKNKKLVIVLSAIIGVLVIAMVVAAIIVIPKLNKPEASEPSTEEQKPVLSYEGSVILANEDDLQNLVNDMVEKAQEGNIAIEYKNMAVSDNGTDFSCYIMNSVSNNYDFYLEIFTDATLEEEIYLSGLIPVGNGIDHFATSKQMGVGTHDAVLVMTQVEDDHATIHAQVMVGLTLIVNQ